MNIDVSQAITDAGAIKIVLAPIGGISDHTFTYFAEIFRAFSVLELSQITPDLTDIVKSALQYRDWQEGEIQFHFCSKAVAQKSDWDDFQANRKVYGVIGIVHCPSSPDLSVAYKEFTQLVSQYTTAQAVRCFAFEPLNDQADNDLGDLPNLVMVPPVADPQKLSFYVQTQLCDLAAVLLNKFDKWIISAESNVVNLTTHVDVNSSQEDVAKLRKRRGGRLAKRLGDMALLSASPLDAKVYFETAVEQARTNNDSLWLGGSLEGLVAATMLASRPFSGSPDEEPNPQELIDKCSEAIANYSRKGALPLEVETTFKLARLYARKGRKIEALELLVHAHDLSLRFGNGDMQMLVCSEIAVVAHLLGCRRKFAFFARQAAGLYYLRSQWSSAHRLALLASSQLHLGPFVSRVLRDIPLPNFAKVEDAAMSNRTLSARGLRLGWPALQLQVLEELMIIEEWMNDNFAALLTGAFMLRSLCGYMDSTKQQSLWGRMQQLSQNLPAPVYSSVSLTTTSPDQAPSDPLAVDLVGFPPLLSCVPQGLPSHLRPLKKVAPVAAASASDNPFIYCHFGGPQKSKNKVEVMWLQDEIVHVRVNLANPFAFELRVDSIALRTSGVAFESYATSVVLAPQTRSEGVVVEGKALGAGTLWLLGCTMRLMGISSFHPINYDGIGISLDEFSKLEEGDPTISATAVTVLPSLPLLMVSEAVPGPSDLSLHEGEIMTVSVQAENVGKEAIDWMSVSCSYASPPTIAFHELLMGPDGALGESLSKKPMVVWDEAALSKRMPLMPGRSLELKLTLRGILQRSGATVKIEYGVNDDEMESKVMAEEGKEAAPAGPGAGPGGEAGVSFYREALVPLPVHTGAAISVEAADVLPGDTFPQRCILEWSRHCPYLATCCGRPELEPPVRSTSARLPSSSSSHPSKITPTPTPNSSRPSLSHPHPHHTRRTEDEDWALIVLDVRNSSSRPFHLSCCICTGRCGRARTDVSRPCLLLPPLQDEDDDNVTSGVVIDAESAVRVLVPVDRPWLACETGLLEEQVVKQQQDEEAVAAALEAKNTPSKSSSSYSHHPPPPPPPHRKGAPLSLHTLDENRRSRRWQCTRRVLARSISLRWRSSHNTSGAVPVSGGLASLSHHHLESLHPDPLRVRFRAEPFGTQSSWEPPTPLLTPVSRAYFRDLAGLRGSHSANPSPKLPSANFLSPALRAPAPRSTNDSDPSSMEPLDLHLSLHLPPKPLAPQQPPKSPDVSPSPSSRTFEPLRTLSNYSDIELSSPLPSTSLRRPIPTAPALSPSPRSLRASPGRTSPANNSFTPIERLVDDSSDEQRIIDHDDDAPPPPPPPHPYDQSPPMLTKKKSESTPLERVLENECDILREEEEEEEEEVGGGGADDDNGNRIGQDYTKGTGQIRTISTDFDFNNVTTTTTTTPNRASPVPAPVPVPLPFDWLDPSPMAALPSGQESVGCGLRRRYRISCVVRNQLDRRISLKILFQISPLPLSGPDVPVVSGCTPHVVWIGSLEGVLSDLAPRSLASVHTIVCFLAAGQYSLSVTCEERQRSGNAESDVAPLLAFSPRTTLHIDVIHS